MAILSVFFSLVCRSHSCIESKRLNRWSWFLGRKLPSPIATLCYERIWIKCIFAGNNYPKLDFVDYSSQHSTGNRVYMIVANVADIERQASFTALDSMISQ